MPSSTLQQIQRWTLKSTGRHPFNGLFSRTIWVRWHQKDKNFLDFNEATDDGVAVASAGQYANHLHLAADRSPQMLFTTNSVKSLKANSD